jgi:myo-inositol-1(or 4)-monophosphatase
MTENDAVIGSKSFTAVAVNCASKAGEWIKSRIGQVAEPDLKISLHDLVTEVDKGSERLIRNLIGTHFPGHSFLGEEGVEPGPEASVKALQKVSEEEYLWIVDPIDGTTNYVHGFPFFTVSIALAHRGEVIVGVVYDPSHDELFVAERGKGAYVHGRKMKVSEEKTLAQSLVGTGFPAEHQLALPRNLQQIRTMAPQVRNIRTAGSAALQMAYVAAGRLSGFWEIGLNSWDLAAGSLLVEEAGGTVSDQSGDAYHLGVRNVAASNGIIHEQFLKELAKA